MIPAQDAVDLTLCNNPQTREVWAAARVQAALDAGYDVFATVAEQRGPVEIWRAR
jgi:hypothetical protein